MAMPAPCQMANLGPGIGIEQVLPCRGNPDLQQQPPVIDQVGADKAQIVGFRALPMPVVGIAREPVGRLVDADDKVVRILLRQMQC